MASYLIYGANGYTGSLIVQTALPRGHRPILAGRSDAVAALAAQYASAAAPLAGPHPLAAAALIESAAHHVLARPNEPFNVRQPDHIVLAGELGLGNFDRDKIWHRRVTLA